MKISRITGRKEKKIRNSFAKRKAELCEFYREEAGVVNNRNRSNFAN